MGMETMIFEDIQKLTSRMETGQVEFKETTGQLDRGMETLCAFLNGDGGTVLYGVTDKGKIIGQEVSDHTKRMIAEAIQRIEPLPVIRISYIPVGGSEKEVIVIHAEEQRYDRPFTYKNRAYRRLESVTSAMPQDIYNSLLMQRGGAKYSWESLINEDLRVQDLDEDEIAGTVRLGIENGRLPETTISSDIPVILEKLDLSKNGKLKNAAAILFAKNTSDYPQCLLRMARFKGVDKTEFTDNQRIKGNLFKLLDAAMAFFFKHLSLSGKINGLLREEELTVPVKALRECCTNALCHRTYNRPGSSVGIAIYDDRIEIENSGTFPSDMTIEKLKSEHRSEPQNPLIADVLYKRKVLENWGRGIGLMIDECRRVGIPEPEFHTNGNFVWVIFRYGEQVTGQATMQATMQAAMQATMQVQKLVSLMGAQPLSVKEMMKLVSLNNRDYFRKEYLKPALEAELITPLYPQHPNHPKQKYFLTAKGQELIKE